MGGVSDERDNIVPGLDIGSEMLFEVSFEGMAKFVEAYEQAGPVLEVGEAGGLGRLPGDVDAGGLPALRFALRPCTPALAWRRARA